MKLSSYLNFDGNGEEAMNFYKKVFGVEFAGEGIMRMADMPGSEGKIPEDMKNRLLHATLPIGDDFLMASDTMPGMGGPPFKAGNNNYICIAPDTKEEADRLFNELSAGGNVEMPMSQEFFGYFGSFIDKFGTPWMINYTEQSTF